MFDDLDINNQKEEDNIAEKSSLDDSARNFNADLAKKQASEKLISGDNHGVKKIAPPPPAISEFNKRIKALRAKGKKRGRRYSIIGISSSIAICILVLAGGYYLLTEVFSISDQVDKSSSLITYPINDPKGVCSDDCCLSSLLRIKKNNYQEYNEARGCPPAYEKKSLDCSTSLSWCAPVETPEPIEENNLLASTTRAEQINDFSAASSTLFASSSSVNNLSSSTIIKNKNIDKDKDGLSDSEEAKYGTDPNNPDTDGDGYSDGDEIKNGYNPLGEGKL